MKTHTFRVTCSFVIQHSFTEAEVMVDPEGREGDIVPTESALTDLQSEIEASLGEDYAISTLIVETESDDLLGTAED